MFASAAVCLSLIGCSGPATRPIQDGPPLAGPAAFDEIPDAMPRAEPRSKYGNPVSYEVNGKRYHVMQDSEGYSQRGYASWYGRKFHGRRTSSGEPYDMYAMTAAHRTLPLPVFVRVTNLDNGKQIIVRVNDRGPFHSNRIIDLSYAAAMKLDIVRNGTGRVQVQVIDPDSFNEPAAAQPVALHKAPEAGPRLTPVNKTTIQDSLYLQAGAFRQRSNADKLVRQLRQAGLQGVEIIQDGIDQLFRVRAGPYVDHEQLFSDRDRLKLLGISAHVQAP